MDLKNLENDYYGTKMLSVSSVKLFAQNPKRALDDWQGKESWFADQSALTFGNYVHSGLQDALENTNINHDKFVEKHPEMFKKDGTLYAKFIQADVCLNAILKSSVFNGLLKASNNLKMLVEKAFASEYDGISFKGKLDVCFIDKDNKKVHCIDFKTSKAYPQNGIDWGTLIDGQRDKCSVAWHVEKLFPMQAGVYRKLLQDNGYSDFDIDYTYIVVTKEASPRIDVWNITNEAMDKGLELFLDNLVLANDYITGKQEAPIVYDDSAWAHKLTLKTPNKLVAEVMETEEEQENNLISNGKEMFAGVI